MPPSSKDQWIAQLTTLDEHLRPIATRTVDLRQPDWSEKLQGLQPLDEAGVRRPAQDLLQQLIEAYASGDEGVRIHIRSLFRRFHSFAWAASLEAPRTSAEGFRAHLLHFSVCDQGDDPRDAKLWLDDILQTARGAGVDVAPALREVAALSATEPRYSWGSTQQWLIDRLNG